MLAPVLSDLVVLSVMLYHYVFVPWGGGGKFFCLVDSGVPLVQGFIRIASLCGVRPLI